MLSDFAIGDITKTAREEAPSPFEEPTAREQEASSESTAEKTTFKEFRINLVTILLIIAIIAIIIITLKVRKK